MRGQGRVGVGHSAEVHDSRDARREAFFRKQRRDESFFVLEVLGGHERVQQVIRDVNAGDRPREVVAVCGVAIDDLDLVNPGMEAQALGVACHDTDAIAVGEQFPDEPSTDVAGRSRHEAQSGQAAFAAA